MGGFTGRYSYERRQGPYTHLSNVLQALHELGGVPSLNRHPEGVLKYHHVVLVGARRTHANVYTSK